MMCKIYRAENKMAVSDIYNAVNKAKQAPIPTDAEYAKVERLLKITGFKASKSGDKYFVRLGDESDGLVQVRIEGKGAFQAWLENVAMKIATFNLSHLVIQGRYREEARKSPRFTEYNVFFRVAKGTTIDFETAKRHVPITITNDPHDVQISPTKNVIAIYGEFETVSALTRRELSNVIDISKKINTEENMETAEETTTKVEDMAKTIADDMQERYCEPAKTVEPEATDNWDNASAIQKDEPTQQTTLKALENFYNSMHGLLEITYKSDEVIDELDKENKELKAQIEDLQGYKQKFEAVQAMFK